MPSEKTRSQFYAARWKNMASRYIHFKNNKKHFVLHGKSISLIDAVTDEHVLSVSARV